jgi:hypothetical protein
MNLAKLFSFPPGKSNCFSLLRSFMSMRKTDVIRPGSGPQAFNFQAYRFTSVNAIKTHMFSYLFLSGFGLTNNLILKQQQKNFLRKPKSTQSRQFN